MKKMQIKKDKQNISAVCVTMLGARSNYMIFYKSGSKRSFSSPSSAFCSRFDWWYRRFDSDDSPIPLNYSNGVRVVVLTPYYDSDLPDSLFAYYPALQKVVDDGFII